MQKHARSKYSVVLKLRRFKHNDVDIIILYSIKTSVVAKYFLTMNHQPRPMNPKNLTRNIALQLLNSSFLIFNNKLNHITYRYHARYTVIINYR